MSPVVQRLLSAPDWVNLALDAVEQGHNVQEAIQALLFLEQVLPGLPVDPMAPAQPQSLVQRLLALAAAALAGPSQAEPTSPSKQPALTDRNVYRAILHLLQTLRSGRRAWQLLLNDFLAQELTTLPSLHATLQNVPAGMPEPAEVQLAVARVRAALGTIGHPHPDQRPCPGARGSHLKFGPYVITRCLPGDDGVEVYIEQPSMGGEGQPVPACTATRDDEETSTSALLKLGTGQHLRRWKLDEVYVTAVSKSDMSVSVTTTTTPTGASQFPATAPTSPSVDGVPPSPVVYPRLESTLRTAASLALAPWPQRISAQRLHAALLDACHSWFEDPAVVACLLAPPVQQEAPAPLASGSVSHPSTVGAEFSPLETALTLAVTPSPVRIALEDQLSEACQAMLDEAPAAPSPYPPQDNPQLVSGSQAVTSIEASSNVSAAKGLLDEDTRVTMDAWGEPRSHGWTSCGQEGLHWVTLRIRPGLAVESLHLLHAAADGSFQPQRVTVGGGNCNKPPRREIEIPRDSTRTLLLDRQDTHYPDITIHVVRCQHGGRDTKIRGLDLVCRLLSPTVSGVDIDDMFDVSAVAGSLQKDTVAHDGAGVGNGGAGFVRLNPLDSLPPWLSVPLASVVQTHLYAFGRDTAENLLPLLVAPGAGQQLPAAATQPHQPRLGLLPTLAQQLRRERVRRIAVQRQGAFIVTAEGQLMAVDQERGVTHVAFPTEVTMLDVSMGAHHVLALTVDGQVYARGSGKHGALGFGDYADRSSFAKLGGSLHQRGLELIVPTQAQVQSQPHIQTQPLVIDAVAVACGLLHSAIVTRDGRLLMCGSNKDGQLGLPLEVETQPWPTAVPSLPPVRQVACGHRHTVAVSTSGAVYAWGCVLEGRCGPLPGAMQTPPPHTRPVQVPGLVNVVRVACGPSSSAAMTAQGHVYVWGVARDGRLGVGSGSTSVVWHPQLLKALDDVVVVDMSLGHRHGAAVTRHGSVFVWGRTSLQPEPVWTPQRLVLPSQSRTAPMTTPPTSNTPPTSGSQVTLSTAVSVACGGSLTAVVEVELDAKLAASMCPAAVVPTYVGGMETGAQVNSGATQGSNVSGTVADPLGQSLLLDAKRVDIQVEQCAESQDAAIGGQRAGRPAATSLLGMLQRWCMPPTDTSPHSFQDVMPHLLRAWSIRLARQLIQQWLVADNGELWLQSAQNPWQAARLMRTLLDLLRLLAARPEMHEASQRVVNAVQQMAQLLPHLQLSLVELGLCELRRMVVFLPSEEAKRWGASESGAARPSATSAAAVGAVTRGGGGAGNRDCRPALLQVTSPTNASPTLSSTRPHAVAVRAQNDRQLLVEYCSLGMLGGVIDVVVACTSTPRKSALLVKLVHALAVLWLRAPCVPLRRWVLGRLSSLVAGCSAKTLKPLYDILADVDVLGEHNVLLCVGADSLVSDEFADETDGGEEEDGESEVVEHVVRLAAAPKPALASVAAAAAIVAATPAAPQPQTRATPASSSSLQLTTAEFARYNMSGSGRCDVMELAILLAHHGIQLAAWQFQDVVRGWRQEAVATATSAGLDQEHDTAAADGEKFSHKAVHALLENLAHNGMTARPAAASSLGDTSQDDSLHTTLHEFANALWDGLLWAYANEADAVKNGMLLMHSAGVRRMAALACTLQVHQLGGSTPPPVWFQRYSLVMAVCGSLWQRRPFPPALSELMQASLAARGGADDTATGISAQGEGDEGSQGADGAGCPLPLYLDNHYFSAAMDAQLLQWKTVAPEALAVPLRSTPAINLPRLHFEVSATNRTPTLDLANDNRTVSMRPDNAEENTWALSDTVLMHGLHYWAMRCDAKGSARRYVGVGVGRVDSQFPTGTARLLSDGHVKSASLTIKVDQGFQEHDIIGVLLDMDQYKIAFDVNGVKRCEIGLPDMAPGEGVQPLAYLFCPKDKVGSGREETG